MSQRKPATPNEVRTWANENGFTLGARGVIPADAIKAFQSANRGLEYVIGHTQTRSVKVATKDKRGRNRTATVQVTAAEARAAHDGSPFGRLPEVAYENAAQAKLG